MSKPKSMPHTIPNRSPLQDMARTATQTWALSLMAGSASMAVAQTVPAEIQPTVHPIAQTQRLTDWLRTNADTADKAYPLATAWTTPEEAPKQKQAHQELLHKLQQTLQSPSNNPLLVWMQDQAVTGRMRLPAVQMEWLDANPQRTPVLQPGDTLTTQPRSGHVSLLRGDGQGCKMAHQSSWAPHDYLHACPATASLVDHTLWVIQPNGRVQTTSAAHWNPMLQPQLAPHALLWTGWSQSSLKPGTPESTREQLNTATAQWLAQRTDGLASWINRWPVTPTPTQPRQPPTTQEDWTGLQGPRFDPIPSASNWGVVGLMQTPTARMRPAGSFGLNYHRTSPYSMINVMLQPLDGLEAGFRYTDISNRLYGPADFSGSQGYKDKSFDIKARLWNESAWLPAMAAGIRDLGGTGLFGSEYVVASKRWGRLDFSMGMAWGYLGNRQNLFNPLSMVNSRFDQRQKNVGTDFTVSTQSFFRGRTALFGGVEYQTPWGPVLKAEYDSNNYQNEPFANTQAQKTPLNLGLVYRLAPGLDLSLARERGTTWSVGFTLYTDLSRLAIPKLTDTPVPPVALQAPSTAPHWPKTGQDIQTLTQWQVQQIQRQDNTLILDLTESDTAYHRPRIDKAMAVLQRDAPADITHIELRHRALGDVLTVDHINREAWLRPFAQPARTSTPSPAVTHSYPPAHSLAPGNSLQTTAPKLYSLTPGIHLNQSIGGPDAFVLYQLNLKLNGQLALPGDVQLSGSLNAGLVNNYDRFKYTAPSDLPRVRTYMREYLTESRLTLPNLYLSRVQRLSTNWTSAVYAGYLESMFAGVGGEMLYRQPGSRWAAGLDINQVQQRDFAQNFSFRDYKAKTGHASLYWQTPWQDVNMALSVGQYLAQDRGATLSMSRTFDNGVTMGAFATKTNVSAAQFGEGSFNKGVFWSIPFDAFMTSSSRQTAYFNWTPLTRDGGAMLNRPVQLMNATRLLDPRLLTQRPAEFPDDQRIPDDRRH
jgi:hypothetical protein